MLIVVLGRLHARPCPQELHVVLQELADKHNLREEAQEVVERLRIEVERQRGEMKQRNEELARMRTQANLKIIVKQVGVAWVSWHWVLTVLYRTRNEVAGSTLGVVCLQSAHERVCTPPIGQ